MAGKQEQLKNILEAALGNRIVSLTQALGELTLVIDAADYLSAAQTLRDDPALSFAQLMDLCGVDYSAYGNGGWKGARFAVTSHLLSVRHNWRVRLRAWCDAGEPPMIDSVVEIWKSADWYEREAFDLFGILFRGHPDLRRILTDYGFVGHPFRKDFPLSGNVEVRYDPAKGRVVYEPVSIEPRTLVPRVIRDDNRHGAPKEAAKNG